MILFSAEHNDNKKPQWYNQKYTLYSELDQPLMFEMHSKFTLYIYKMYIFIK